MKLILVRHARAAERRVLQRDRSRTLTRDGKQRMRKAARGLKSLLPNITHIVTSPLTRARQTADILAQAYGEADRHVMTEMAPGGDARVLLRWLRTLPGDSSVALVGHEPDLGRLAGWLLTGRHVGFLVMKKGGVASIEFDDLPRAGGGVLGWLHTAGQLAALH